jgi:hypothetical protein
MSAAKPVSFVARVTWPVRGNFSQFSCYLQHKHIAFATVSYPATYEVLPELKLNGTSWTCVDLQWSQPFVGGEPSAHAWVRTTAGNVRILTRVEELSNDLIAALRASYSNDRNFAGLRNFGVRDWPYYEYGVSGLEPVRRIGVHAESQFRSVPTLPFSGNPVSVLGASSFPARALLRASDLAESGYPTEAVLIAFGALDAAVQSFLVRKLKERGVDAEAAGGMLRNITTRRLTTYLTSVLKLVAGTSIASNEALAAGLTRANKARNEAIHNGYEISRVESIEIISLIADTFEFLISIDEGFEPEYVRPHFYPGI